jgi:flagellar assembly protein FliH
MFDPTTIFAMSPAEGPASLPSWLAPPARAPQSTARHAPTSAPTPPSVARPESVAPLSEYTEPRRRGTRPSMEAVVEPIRVSEMPRRDYEAELDALRRQLESALLAMAQLRRQVLEESEGELVRLAVAVAEKVVGRELRSDKSLIADWARAAVARLGDEERVTIVVSPDVADVLSAAWVEQVGVAIDIMVDDNLPPVSCEVRGAARRIDVRAASRLVALATAVGIDEGGEP